jgi:hypothetical protein
VAMHAMFIVTSGFWGISSKPLHLQPFTMKVGKVLAQFQDLEWDLKYGPEYSPAQFSGYY